jgi:hypothetical protein
MFLKEDEKEDQVLLLIFPPKKKKVTLFSQGVEESSISLLNFYIEMKNFKLRF